MHTPTTPEGRKKWDHLRWPDDVLAAWLDPGANPEWHARAQQVVREAMPLVADILDREADKKLHPPEQRRTRRLRPDPDAEYPPPPWETDRGSER